MHAGTSTLHPVSDGDRRPSGLLQNAMCVLREIQRIYSGAGDYRAREARRIAYLAALSVLACDLQEHRSDFETFSAVVAETAKAMGLWNNPVVKILLEHIQQETTRWEEDRCRP